MFQWKTYSVNSVLTFKAAIAESWSGGGSGGEKIEKYSQIFLTLPWCHGTLVP